MYTCYLFSTFLSSNIACDGYYNATSGTFGENIPNYYFLSSTTCVYIFQGTPGDFVTVVFNDFTLSYDSYADHNVMSFPSINCKYEESV